MTKTVKPDALPAVDELARLSLGRYLRGRREGREMSLRDLAHRAGLSESMASYIAQLERGVKVPSQDVAAALARSLEDDPRIYGAWAALGRRRNWEVTARALETLAGLLDDPTLRRQLQRVPEMRMRAYAAVGEDVSPARVAPMPEFHTPSLVLAPGQPLRGASQVTPDPGDSAQPDAGAVERVAGAREVEALPRLAAVLQEAGIAPDELSVALTRHLAGPGGRVQPLAERAPGGARDAARLLRFLFDEAHVARPGWVLIPEYAEGADPASAPQAGTRRLSPDELAGVADLVRPFAWRLSEAGVRRLPDLLEPGRFAILSRPPQPYAPGAPCAVRVGGELLLARVLWNRRQLLLLPAPGQGDFVTLEAPDENALARLVAGRVVGMVVSGWE